MEQLIVVLFLIFFALDFLIEFVLNELNLRFVRARSAEKDIPDSFRGKISPDAYEKSVEYSLAKGRFREMEPKFIAGPLPSWFYSVGC